MLELHILLGFLTWCTIISGTVLVLSVMIIFGAPDFVYKTQKKLFRIPRKIHDVIVYSYLGVFKVFFIFFNLIPLAALLIII